MAIADTSSVTGANAASAVASTSSASSSDIEQRFLKLLVTQLNNQDPLNPMENAELTSQLAQMSTVSGIEKLNGTLSGLVNQTESNHVLQATALIGHDVLSPGSTLTTGTVADGEGPPEQAFAVELAGAAASVEIQIVDARGQVVRTIDAGTQDEGLRAFTWDGKDEVGAAVPAGNYSFKVKAVNGDAPVAATALTFTKVAAVTQDDKGLNLELVSGESIKPSDVRMYL